MENIWTIVGSIVVLLVTLATARPNWYARVGPLFSIATLGFLAFSGGAFWSVSEITPLLTRQIAQVGGITPTVFAAIANLISAAAPPPMIIPAAALVAAHFGLMFLVDIPTSAHRRNDPGLNNEPE